MPQVDINVIERNCEPFLRQALDSVMVQTMQDWRCIIVDDLSTDNSAAIAQEYVDRDSRFVFHKLDPATRRPFPYARNIGLSLGSAKWIAILDGDDWWEPSKLERQLAALKEAGPGKLVCATDMYVWKNDSVHEHWPGTPTEQIAQGLPLNNVIGQATVLMDREAVMKLGGYDESLQAAEDWDLTLRMLRAYGPDIFLMLGYPAYNYRKHNTSTTSKLLWCLGYEWRVVRRSLKYELWQQHNLRTARYLLDHWINRSVATYRRARQPRGAAAWALLAIVTSPWKKERWVQAWQAMQNWLRAQSKPDDLEASTSKP